VGEIDPETVRAAIIAFARRNDIPVSDVHPSAAEATLGDAARGMNR
jgi:hypothetical protein